MAATCADMTVGRRSEINSNAAILVPHGVEVVINGADLNKDARTKTAPKTDEALKTGQTVPPGVDQTKAGGKTAETAIGRLLAGTLQNVTVVDRF